MADDREALRTTFDRAANHYNQSRPDYPDELIEELLFLTGMQSGDRVLEVGCGTGKATRPLATHGLRITCIEIGEGLAAVARHKLEPFPQVEVVHAAFEGWEPPAGTSFDAVIAATAWHWIDPTVRYRKAWEILRPGGHLAFWSAIHVFPEHGDPFFQEIQEVYDEIGEGLPPGAGYERPGELKDDRVEIEATGLFDEITVRQFDWEIVYDADSYIDLLNTFSGHIAMQPWQRERLYGEIRRRLSARPDGRLRRHWGAALHVAHRKESM